MDTTREERRREAALDKYRPVPVVAPGHTYESLTDRISSIVLRGGIQKGWWIGFLISFALLQLLLLSITYLLVRGVGIWGIQIPVAWGFAIINFVWWIGIGHAGTLISAILLLLRQEWRTSINRFAEAMTLFAVACAGLYPILHLGRPWYFYWLFPYPAATGVWPQFRSPLVWDVFAVTAYSTVSLLFWYVGLVPDLATLRDRAQNRFAKIAYGLPALGWRGSARHWLRYQRTYYLLAALATPLVISVHTIVSFDFAVGIVPGWHSTVFPPFFVAGAIFAGFAMVLIIAIPLRAIYDLEDFITLRHLENMAKVLLTSGLVVAYGYITEMFGAFYSGNQFEIAAALNRLFGPYAAYYWGMLIANVLFPQLFWSKRLRRNTWVLFIVSIAVSIGMWLERFIIVVSSLAQDYLTSSWGLYEPTIWDWLTYLGTIGLFLTLLFLFVRILPVISIFEMRELVSEKEGATAASEGPVSDSGRVPVTGD
ncbi:MAG: polysulfide reductase NrfD [Chloroflexota bacterium]|nr:polysulfide reductase NrfD [Chloroflexota bacterium]